MKNIAIFGSSRCGKTTLSKMLHKKFNNYNIISGDEIRGAFKDIFPELNINSTGGSGMIENFPNYLSCLFTRSINRNRGEMYYIIESCDIQPQKAKELFNRDDTVLVFLGTPRQTTEQHFNEVRKHEIEIDWTYGRSDEEILYHSKYWTEKSREHQEECKRLNIWYVDTSFDREKVLNDTLRKIEERILE